MNTLSSSFAGFDSCVGRYGDTAEAVRERHGKELSLLVRRALRGGAWGTPLARLVQRELRAASPDDEAETLENRIVQRLCENLARRGSQERGPYETFGTPATWRSSQYAQAAS